MLGNFRGATITNLLGTTGTSGAPGAPHGGQINIVAPNSTFDLAPITQWVWSSTVISYWKNRITILVYSAILFLIVGSVLLSQDRVVLNYLGVSSSVSPILGGGVIVGSILILLVFVRELRILPTYIRVADVYMMKVEGTLPAGNYFNNLETAIRLNDWVTARYWARRSHLEHDFDPSP